MRISSRYRRGQHLYLLGPSTARPVTGQFSPVASTLVNREPRAESAAGRLFSSRNGLFQNSARSLALRA